MFFGSKHLRDNGFDELLLPRGSADVRSRAAAVTHIAQCVLTVQHLRPLGQVDPRLGSGS